jgi:uncharacterized protein YbbC (DUF1343 family)
VGAPWIDGERLADTMNATGLPGAHFRPIVFEPTFQKHARQTCGGCQVHVTDRRAFRPVLTSVALLAECRRQSPERFAWRQPPYEYEREKMPIDILYGSDELRAQLEAGTPAAAIVEGWEDGESRFRSLSGRHRLY